MLLEKACCASDFLPKPISTVPSYADEIGLVVLTTFCYEMTRRSQRRSFSRKVFVRMKSDNNTHKKNPPRR